MTSMASKKKRKPRKPPAPKLSKSARILYWIWIAVCVALFPFGVLGACGWLSQHLLEQNPDLLLYSNNWLLLSGIFSILLIMPGCMVSAVPFSLEMTLWGRSALARKHRKEMRVFARPALAASIVFIGIALLCVCPRHEAEADGSVTRYNCFNHAIRYEPEDLASLEITPKYYGGKTSSGWGVRFIVTTEDGHRCRFFTKQDFADMLAFKNAVPEEIVTVSGHDRVTDIAESYDRRTEEEVIALYELFELPY